MLEQRDTVSAALSAGPETHPSNSPEAGKRYLRTHQIPQLFQQLVAALVVEQPENPKQFLLRELQELKLRGFSKHVEKYPSSRPSTPTNSAQLSPRTPHASMGSIVSQPSRTSNSSTIETQSPKSPRLSLFRGLRHSSSASNGNPPSPHSPKSAPLVSAVAALKAQQLSASANGGAISPTANKVENPTTYGPLISPKPRSSSLSEADRRIASAVSVSSAAQTRTRSSSVTIDFELTFHKRDGPHIRETSRVTTDKDAEGRSMVNQYIIQQPLGAGTFGKVKLGVDNITGQKRAIKIVKKSRLKKMRTLRPGEVNDALQDLRSEIALMKKMSHPNIVALYEVMDDPAKDKIYMVLEYCDGGEVMRLTAGEVVKPIEPEERVWRYFRDLIAGLEYLHENKIIHHDIKPENLLLTADDRLKISDFGVSEICQTDDAALRKTRGSPAFLAPEVCSGEAFQGKPVDIWAAGVTLYCFVFGHVPFMGTSVMEIYDKIVASPLKFDAHRRVEPMLIDLLQKMLTKDPAKRIPMSEIKQHPWVTKNGSHPMPELVGTSSLLVSDVTEYEITSAVKKINSLVVLLKAKTVVRKMAKRGSIDNDTPLEMPLAGSVAGPQHS